MVLMLCLWLSGPELAMCILWSLPRPKSNENVLMILLRSVQCDGVQFTFSWNPANFLTSTQSQSKVGMFVIFRNLKKFAYTQATNSHLQRPQSEFTIYITRQCYYLKTSTPSHMLKEDLRWVTSLQTLTLYYHLMGISYLTQKTWTLHTAPFSPKLYASEIICNLDRGKAFLDSLTLKTVPSHVIASLEAPLTLAKFKNDISTMNRDKSLGIDGIPPRFYLSFCYILDPQS